MKNQVVLAVAIVLFFCSCNSKPSDALIKKKILMEFVCAESAVINNFRILDTKDAESALGTNKGYEYHVSGEVEWPKGCNEFGTGITPGKTEKFENKTVFLIKGDDGEWY